LSNFFTRDFFKNIFTKKQNEETRATPTGGTIASWIDDILSISIPDTVTAFCFNLYEESDGSWAMELVGTERFDLEDEDWACDELTDFGSREHPYTWEMDSSWNEAFAYVADELQRYLESGKNAHVLKSRAGVGVGFADGDIEILFAK